MKKLKYLLSIIILTIALVCISNSNSKAVFYIEKFDIQAQVKENGDMQITENIIQQKLKMELQERYKQPMNLIKIIQQVDYF